MSEKKPEKDLTPEIHKMELHQVVYVGANTTCKRVPGGWIYTTVLNPHRRSGGGTDGTPTVSSVFVPYNKEFKPPTPVHI